MVSLSCPITCDFDSRYLPRMHWAGMLGNASNRAHHLMVDFKNDCDSIVTMTAVTDNIIRFGDDRMVGIETRSIANHILV